MLHERVKSVRETVFKGSQEDFAQLLGWSTSRVKDLERGKVKELRATEAEQIEDKLLVDGWWLLTGKGGMLLAAQETKVSERFALPVSATNNAKVIYRPNVSASAGFGVLNHYDDTSEAMEISKTFLMALGLVAFKDLDLIHVFGDSMEPFVSNGELVIIERTAEAKNNDVVIAVVDGQTYIKKLQKDPFGKIIRLISTNPIYMDIELRGNELDYLVIAGVVRAKIRPI